MPPDAPVISTLSPGRTRRRARTTPCGDENGPSATPARSETTPDGRGAPVCRPRRTRPAAGPGFWSGLSSGDVSLPPGRIVVLRRDGKPRRISDFQVFERLRRYLSRRTNYHNVKILAPTVWRL